MKRWNRKIRLISRTFAAIIMIASMALSAFADSGNMEIIGLTTAAPIETDEDIPDDENITVTVIEGAPSEFPLEENELSSINDIEIGSITIPGNSPESTKRPSDVWNIASKGKYSFKGTTPESSINTLYTEYKFKGKNNYTIYVKNTGKDKVKVKAKRKTKTYASTTISGGKSATITFSGIKKTTEFYITFGSITFLV